MKDWQQLHEFLFAGLEVMICMEGGCNIDLLQTANIPRGWFLMILVSPNLLQIRVNIQRPHGVNYGFADPTDLLSITATKQYFTQTQ